MKERLAWLLVDGERVASCTAPKQNSQQGEVGFSSRDVVPGHIVELDPTLNGAQVRLSKIVRRFTREKAELRGTITINLDGKKYPEKPLTTGFFGYKVDIGLE